MDEEVEEICGRVGGEEMKQMVFRMIKSHQKESHQPNEAKQLAERQEGNECEQETMEEWIQRQLGRHSIKPDPIKIGFRLFTELGEAVEVWVPVQYKLGICIEEDCKTEIVYMDNDALLDSERTKQKRMRILDVLLARCEYYKKFIDAYLFCWAHEKEVVYAPLKMDVFFLED